MTATTTITEGSTVRWAGAPYVVAWAGGGLLVLDGVAHRTRDGYWRCRARVMVLAGDVEVLGE